MRIIEAGINNFGCLHQCEFHFDDDGLMVFEGPNGYGKSTLTVFIKAMFYGLSGNGRSVAGNERKKYAPWQGGSFGGYLIYSDKGTRYRITREFGKTKKDDSFTLSVEDTGKRLSVSADSFGESCFGLDVASFERSVILPQGMAMTEFSTSQISQRLTGLIEAPSRNGGYDVAVKQIKDARRPLKQYKGDGGQLAEVNREITELQERIHSRRQDRVHLDDVRREIAEQNEGLSVIRGQLDEVRISIEEASTKQSELALCEQRASLLKTVEELDAKINAHLSSVPSCDITLEEIDLALDAAKRYESLRLATSNEKSIASSVELVESLSYRFDKGVPSESSLQTIKEDLINLKRSKKGLENLKPTEQEVAELSRIRETLPNEFAGEQTIIATQRLIDEKNRLAGSLAAIKDSSSWEKKRVELEDFFSAGVPTNDEISSMESRLDEAERLKARSSELISDSASDGSSNFASGSKRGKGTLLLIAGLLCFVVGVASFGLFEQFAIGIAGAACGLLCVALFFVFGMRSANASTSRRAGDAALAQATDLLDEAAVIEDEVRVFVSGYFEDDLPLRSAIGELRSRLNEMTSVVEAINKNQSDSREIDGQLKQCESDLRESLSGYWSCDASVQSALLRLQTDYLKAQTIEQKEKRYEADRDGLEKTIRESSERIEECLIAYEAKNVLPEFYEEELNQLMVDAASFNQAILALSDRDNAEQERLEELKKRETDLRTFANKIGFSQLLGYQEIQQLRDEMKDLNRQSAQRAKAAEDLSAFDIAHPDIADMSMVPALDDSLDSLNELKTKESKLIADHDRLLSSINENKLNERRFLESVSLIPKSEDQLEDLKEKQADLERKVRVLDLTEELLAQAKESLSHKYLGPVVEAFDRYCALLFGDSISFRVDEKLQITVEYKGGALKNPII